MIENVGKNTGKNELFVCKFQRMIANRKYSETRKQEKKGTLEREISQEMWMYNVTSLKFWSGSTAGIYKKLGK